MLGERGSLRMQYSILKKLWKIYNGVERQWGHGARLTGGAWVTRGPEKSSEISMTWKASDMGLTKMEGGKCISVV